DPVETTPLHTTFRGYDVYSFVPPSGGWQVLQALNLLEQVDASKLDEIGQVRSEMVIKALNKSHNDRLDNAIDDYANYGAEVAKKISKAYARKLWEQSEDANGGSSKSSKEGETTHFSIVDKNGMAVSVTSSIGSYFGSLTSTKSLGFFYNSYVKSLMGFGLGKSLEPRTQIPSSMSPSLVRKDGKNVLVIGTPGSKRIVSTISQLIQLWVDSEESITDIINYPRIHAIRNKVYLEDSHLNYEWLRKLRDLGYTIAFPSYSLTISDKNAYFGGVHAVEFKNGEWKAAADPRRDGKSN
ncbi:MAG: gamma-glutamyltransferase, partial [Allomuricauda sp.]